MPFIIGFLLWPIAEIWLLIEIGGEIGAWATIGWILLTAVAGTYLIRSQGALAMSRIRQALADVDARGGEASGTLAGELLDGLAVFFAGICLILPGFLTDAIGILLVLPVLRRTLGRGLWGWLQGSQRVRVYAASGRGPFGRGPFERGAGGGPTVIEGDYRDVTDPDPQNRLPPQKP
ncbi:MAG TPA: FxsA family protein [Alphaproteobacteria bacterium]|nr:FxsA family protein [Alphaproteobacteria bacterium]